MGGRKSAFSQNSAVTHFWVTAHQLKNSRLEPFSLFVDIPSFSHHIIPAACNRVRCVILTDNAHDMISCVPSLSGCRESRAEQAQNNKTFFGSLALGCIYQSSIWELSSTYSWTQRRGWQRGGAALISLFFFFFWGVEVIQRGEGGSLWDELTAWRHRL